jgi:predicted ATPase/DNA-binding NarL/FixJ family response regulator
VERDGAPGSGQARVEGRGALVALPAPERPSGPSRLAGPPSLPAAVASFIGRERQIEELGARLSAHRLVTLTGPGGVGKTRLALEVARRAPGRSVDRVQFVPLASLADPSLVETEVLHALGLRESPEQPPQHTLALALQGRDVLLVLDNFEHVLAAARSVATWLQVCPGLTVLVTSRAPLDLPGEQLYQVPPLTLPESGDGADAAEAVRLFVDRAHAVRSDFELTAANAGAVAEICRRLDGLPLAIELAAVWARMLSPQQIAARLDDRFRLLVGGSRAVPARQRTLQATIDWSYALLSAEERVLLRRLAVFAGGWTLEAAEAVCSADDLPDMLDSLFQLIDKSLVTVNEMDGRMRYRLLEVIRQYGAERLAEAGETDILRHRHAEWTLAFAERAETELWGPDQVAWLERLDVEHDNIRAALAWSAQAGEVELGYRLCWLLVRFWEQRGHASEARRWMIAQLDRPSPRPSLPRAMGLMVNDYLAHLMGEQSASQPREEALALARAEDDQVVLCWVLILEGVIVGNRGDPATTKALFEEALVLARESGWEPGARLALLDLGLLAGLRGALDQAAAQFEEARALAETAGDAYTHLYSLMCLARLELQQGKWDTSASRSRQALTIWRDLHDLYNVAMIIEILAWPISAQGLAQRAARLLGAAEALRRVVGAVLIPVFQADHDRALTTAQAALGESVFAAVWAEGRAMPVQQAIEYALEVASVGPTTPAQSAARRSAEPAAGALTRREREVVERVANGLTNRRIADELVVSERTVEWHVSKLLSRLGLQSRAQLALWALEQGVLPAE